MMLISRMLEEFCSRSPRIVLNLGHKVVLPVHPQMQLNKVHY